MVISTICVNNTVYVNSTAYVNIVLSVNNVVYPKHEPPALIPIVAEACG